MRLDAAMRSPRTVLIVDDHDGFRAAARLVMESGGWIVVGEVDTADAALTASVLLRPRLVLLDVSLPGDDGFAVARRLDMSGVTGAVVLVSSREEPWYAEMAREAGAAGFLRKDHLSCAAIADLVG